MHRVNTENSQVIHSTGANNVHYIDSGRGEVTLEGNYRDAIQNATTENVHPISFVMLMWSAHCLPSLYTKFVYFF